MTDIDEIIDYIKSLKKGFDKDLFQTKIDELAQAVDTVGLDIEDFHTLFKVWLNLSIPITKWVSIGVCLVPQSSIPEQSVDYALRWLLATQHDQTAFTRIAFLLDWLTAAMDCESIDISALDSGYEVFFSFLTYEVLTAHVLKLVYTLSKPTDVTRPKVLEILDYTRKRENKKSMCRQLQVLLGLFKSYKPELVPENVPAVPVHTTFKTNITLLTRFKRWQDQRNATKKESQHLMWTNPMLGRQNKKGDSLVPSIEFLNIGLQLHSDKEPQQNYLDFTEPVSLLQFATHRAASRPARLRALLRNDAGLVLLALSTPQAHAALQLDLGCMLSCFLDASPHSEAEKRDALHRIAALQRALCQPLRPVSEFLEHFLPLWDEAQYFSEILELLEWVDVGSGLPRLLTTLQQIYQRAEPARQCAILRTMTTMYTNLVYASTRRQQVMGPAPPRETYLAAMRAVAEAVHAMCGRALQANPDDIRLLHSSMQAAERMGIAELAGGVPPGALPAPAALALALLGPSAALLERAAGLILLYKKIMFAMQSSKETQKDRRHSEQKQVLKGYTSDLVRCLVEEGMFSGRQNGFAFRRLHPQVAQKLTEYVPDADSMLSMRHHLALAPYTYLQIEGTNSTFADNELWFEVVINQEFKHLSTLFLKLGWGRKIVS